MRKTISPRWDGTTEWDLDRMVYFTFYKQNLYMRMDSSYPDEISPHLNAGEISPRWDGFSPCK